MQDAELTNAAGGHFAFGTKMPKGKNRCRMCGHDDGGYEHCSCYVPQNRDVSVNIGEASR